MLDFEIEFQANLIQKKLKQYPNSKKKTRLEKLHEEEIFAKCINNYNKKNNYNIDLYEININNQNNQKTKQNLKENNENHQKIKQNLNEKLKKNEEFHENNSIILLQDYQLSLIQLKFRELNNIAKILTENNNVNFASEILNYFLNNLEKLEFKNSDLYQNLIEDCKKSIELVKNSRKLKNMKKILISRRIKHVYKFDSMGNRIEQLEKQIFDL